MEKRGRPPGLPKTGGRERGSANKVTTDLRKSVNSFLNENWEDLKKAYKQLEPKDKLVFYEKLMAYSIPKLQSVSQDVTIQNNLEKMTEEQLNKLITQILENE